MSDWVLHMRSWAGVTPGAVHYYGRIECQEHDRSDIRLTRALSAREARELERIEKDCERYSLFNSPEPPTYKEGDETERFLDRESVQAAAIEAFRSVAEPGDALYTHMGWLQGLEPLAVR